MFLTMSKESATSRGVLGSSMTSPIVFAKLFCVFAPDFSCRICCRHSPTQCSARLRTVRQDETGFFVVCSELLGDFCRNWLPVRCLRVN